MEKNAAFDLVERVLENSKVGMLATVGTDGYPHLRWMTPTLIRGRRGFLYTVAGTRSIKVQELESDGRVEWSLQTKALDEILRIRGKAQVVENQTLKSDVLEAIGGYMGSFWRLNPQDSDLRVIETIVETIEYYRPMTGEKLTVTV